MQNKLTKIEINELKIDTIIGIYDNEQIQKQPLIIDLIIYFDSEKAQDSDNIKDTIDYHTITQQIFNIVKNNQSKLLESLAKKILLELNKNKKIIKSEISITKPKALEEFGAIVRLTF